MMTATPWFDRKFDFSFGMEQYQPLYERLQHAPAMYQQTLNLLPEHFLEIKFNDQWSVKENIGHLIVLEDLWYKRFRDIKENKPEMSPADLSNTATDAASFNQMMLHDLLESFSKVRVHTLSLLNRLRQDHFKYASMHPRLQQPMRVIDLMYFVAEHDGHHLNAIQRIIQNNTYEHNN